MDYSQTQQVSAGSARQDFARNTASPTPASQVMVAQGQLDSNINALHCALETLESRLRPVLAMVPEGKGPPNSIKPVASSVAQCIGESAASVTMAIERVQRLLDRLEV